jgi:hypothetical protein
MIATPESDGVSEATRVPASLEPADGGRKLPSPGRQRFFGLIERKMRWSLSWRGRGLATVLVVCLLLLGVFGIHPFLAVTSRTNTDVLVVEGWLPNYALEECISEFHAKHYRLILTVGGEILSGTNIDPGDSLASNAAARLRYLGLKSPFLEPVPSPARYRDRTFASAVALRQWNEKNHQHLGRFNLVTLGPHARRSRLLFEKAFGDKTQVGVISIENREYDPARWWRCSEGVKEVVCESLAYLYARLFFNVEARNREALSR